MTKKAKSIEEQIKLAETVLLEAFARWNYIRTKGCRDPFYPDGENMNLVRQHIMSYKEELENLCKDRELPDSYYIPTPGVVNPDYMAPDGKHYERRLKTIAEIITICPACLAFSSDDKAKIAWQAHKAGKLVKEEGAKKKW